MRNPADRTAPPPLPLAKATITDVARIAGVSKDTVLRFLTRHLLHVTGSAQRVSTREERASSFHR